MEITQDQFTANLQQMPQESQVQVVQLIENTEPPVLQAFAMSLGVTLSMGEEPAPQEPAPEPMLQEPAPEPMQDQMQQLAMGDQVAGMIDQPGAEDETGVADDVPMNVREGAFIINAAALAKVGRKDFEERIIEPAIEYLKEKDGVEIDKADITKPSQQVNGDQKILASNKEYHIPPELAEVIGTDLLEKINDSGKPETEKKLEEQEQQPQQKQEVPVRAANGLQVGDVPRPKIKPAPPTVPRPKMKPKKKVRPSSDQILENQRQVYNKLKEEGLREEAIAGLMGNIHAENDTFEYQRIEDTEKKEKGYGIFQFTGGRRKAYENYLNTMGKTDSLDAQIEYTLDTINIIPAKEDSKFPKWETNDLGYDNRKKLREVFKVGTAEQVANAFLDRFERPKDPEATRKKRVDFANNIFNSAQTLFSTPNSPPKGRTPLALEEKEQTSFMEQRPPIISDAELTALEQGSDINTYSISEPEKDVKPFDPVQSRRQRRRQRRLKAATR